MTRVAFKISKNPYTKENEVFAFFPDEKDRHNGDMHTSYAHVGQHSLCSKAFFDRCRWASYGEYINLYEELVRIGYTDLKVVNRDWYEEDGVIDSFGERINSLEAKYS